LLYDEMISSGKALEKMRRIIEIQYGNPDVVDNYDLLPQAKNRKSITAKHAGYIQAIDTEAIGHASMLLGAGRLRLDSEIDLGVGLMVDAKIGEKVDEGSPLVTLHFNADENVEAAAIIERAYKISDEPVEPPALIKSVLR
jgi:pyrimidine-nucleoside phosphorylase